MLLALLLAQMGCGPDGPLMCRTSTAAPAFAFATSTGVGMGVACACTTPTGTKGEVLTFTRASSGTCLKGSITTGIANGDLVTCTNNQPRVMPGGDGSGGLGLLMETASTNVALRSQELENAVWVGDAIGGGTLPTVTANFGTAPDGTATAERVQFAACTNVQDSALLQANIDVNFTQHASACFVKGNGTSGNIDVVTYNAGAGTWDIATCAFNASTWIRCATTGVTVTTSTASIYVGNLGWAAGAGRSAIDVLLWGCHQETGTFATSYIATAGATVTRAIENASVQLPSATVVEATGSAAATIVFTASNTNFGGVLALNPSTAERFLYVANVNLAATFDTTNIVTTAVGSNMAAPHRLWSSWSGSVLTVSNATDGLTATGAFDGDFQTSATMEIGCNSGGAGPLNGVVKQVCVDPSPSRCR